MFEVACTEDIPGEICRLYIRVEFADSNTWGERVLYKDDKVCYNET